MRIRGNWLVLGVFLGGFASLANAQEPAASGGKTLLQAPGARAAALGQAFTAVENDITAFSYNPSSLKSLKTGHASFLYQKGLTDDSYGQFMIGAPLSNGRSVGLSLGFLNGGTVEIFDGTATQNVTAKRDLNLAVGVARNVGRVSVGVAGKYLSSQLGERVQAQAVAADLGARLQVDSRIQLGAAIQNVGTKLKFINEGQNLPRLVRAGASILIFPNSYSTTLMLDVPYLLNEQEARPAIGIETQVGLLAIRAGYRRGSALEGFSFGTGFFLGSASLDYSFGLTDELNTRHTISLSTRFGTSNTNTPLIAKQPEPKLDEKEDPQINLLGTPNVFIQGPKERKINASGQ